MIPAWEAVLESALISSRPRGELHIVDFGTMETMPGLPRRAMRAWLARFSVTPRLDLEQASAKRPRGMAGPPLSGKAASATRRTRRSAGSSPEKRKSPFLLPLGGRWPKAGCEL